MDADEKSFEPTFKAQPSVRVSLRGPFLCGVPAGCSGRFLPGGASGAGKLKLAL